MAAAVGAMTVVGEVVYLVVRWSAKDKAINTVAAEMTWIVVVFLLWIGGLFDVEDVAAPR
jgi:hypothetical protein